MKRLPFAAVFLALLPLAARAEEKGDNPFRNAKVGDWVEYKMVTNVGAFKADGTVKMTVTAKTDKEATLKGVATVNGTETPAQETKIDLTKPYDPLSAANLPKGADVKVEKTGMGKDKVKAMGKDYDCDWVKFKVNGKSQGVDLDGDAKVWMSKAAPLGGMVKMEMNAKVAGMDMKMTMELANSGSK